MVYIFLFKRKTAYELRISDWSSDGCASDPSSAPSSTRPTSPARRRPSGAGPSPCSASAASPPRSAPTASSARLGKRFAVGRYRADRKSAVKGTSVSVRVDLGGRRYIKKKKRLLVYHYERTKIHIKRI